jgi:hypothetical protein
VSKLSKENFNLKLELHHRRERQETLEARLEAAEKQLIDQKELQEVNDQLLAELEKRDKALEEAVILICDLEDKNDRLMEEREVVRSFDTQYKSHTGIANDPSSSPPQFQQKLSTNKTIIRMPSFLSDTGESTEALRSLYLPHCQSLPKLLEEQSIDEIDRLGSPHLSVLSESSFVSIYGEKKSPRSADDEEEEEEEEAELPMRRLRTSESVERWIDDRPVSTALALRNDNGKKNYLSLNDVVESPLQRIEKLKSNQEKNVSSVRAARRQLESGTSLRESGKQRDNLRRVFVEKSSFNLQEGLPPTPDTVSTSTLRNFQTSTETITQDTGDHTFLNSVSTFPTASLAPPAAYQTNRTRPRSAGETINSRREGHGWDTETQDDISSTVSTKDSFHQPERARTPDLFSFSNLVNPSDDSEDDSFADFGRNMMFSHAPGLPSLTASRYVTLRQSNVAENPASDDTVRESTRYNEPQYGILPLDISPQPSPPARCSSLSHGVKLRKSRNIYSSSSGQQTASPASTKSESKKRGIATRLFNRSDTAPTSASSPILQRNSPRAQQLSDQYSQEDDRETATPPPIKRSRDTNAPLYRPSSAGAGAQQQAQRRASVFGSDGSRIFDGANEEQGGDDGQKKKWFSLSRSTSLRRT